MLADQKAVEASMLVKQTVLGQETSDDSFIRVHKFLTEPAYVSISGGRTLNTGNYESVKISVTLTLPCYLEEIDRVISEATEKVDNEMEERVQTILSALHRK